MKHYRAVLKFTNILMSIIQLTCSFWQQDLCVQYSLLLDTPSPWKFVNTFQAAVFAHLRSKGQSISI